MGADADAHDLAASLGLHIVIHPPMLSRLRAFKRGDQTRVPKSYHGRNRDIVTETDILVATPANSHQRSGSGTWYTVWYADSFHKPVTIIHHDGSVQTINE